MSVRLPPIATSLGARLITYDRPGCGQSDRRQGRTVADCAADVAVIADTLGIDEFAVVGASGGTPPALAVAALLGDRVSRVACNAPLASHTELGADEFARGQDDETREYLAACLGADEEALRVYSAIDDRDRAAASPDEAGDAYVFEQTRQGVWGTIDDDRAHMHPWGFNVADVLVPTTIWYDPRDTVTPPQHAQWIARMIPHADLIVSDALGHGSTGDPVKDRTAMFSWLVKGGAVTR